jgi:hypothetical protein
MEAAIQHVPEPSEIGYLDLKVSAYVRTEITVRSSLEPYEAPVAQLADLVAKIVAMGCPIHIDEVARRITSAFGKSRTASRIVEATEGAVRHALRLDPALRRHGRFLMTQSQSETPPVRDRSDKSAVLLNASCLPPCEIAAGAALVRRESGDVLAEEPTRAVARILVVQRSGSKLSAAIVKALSK